MKDIILKAENISKQYRLGQVGTGMLSHDLNRPVPIAIGINFEVERVEVLGVIGKNGAGKNSLFPI